VLCEKNIITFVMMFIINIPILLINCTFEGTLQAPCLNVQLINLYEN